MISASNMGKEIPFNNITKEETKYIDKYIEILSRVNNCNGRMPIKLRSEIGNLEFRLMITRKDSSQK